MVLKLYGNGLSTHTRTVATVLREKKIPFEIVLVDLKKREHKDPAFANKQPFGQVPYIDDDGFILYESRAIARYLDARYSNLGPKLVPTELKENALFEQAASIETSNFTPFAAKVVIEKVVKPRYGLAPDEAVYEENLKQLSAKLDVYEVILSKQKYLAGNEFTLVDIFHLSFGFLLPAAGSDVLTNEKERPNVARWWKDISNRESWLPVKDGVLESNA